MVSSKLQGTLRSDTGMDKRGIITNQSLLSNSCLKEMKYQIRISNVTEIQYLCYILDLCPNGMVDKIRHCRRNNENKHNAELQWTDTDTKVTETCPSYRVTRAVFSHLMLEIDFYYIHHFSLEKNTLK